MSDISALPGAKGAAAAPAKQRWLIAGLALSALIFSIASLAFSMNKEKPPVFISVSVKSLLEDRLRASLDPSLTPEEVQKRTQEYVVALQTVLNQYQSDGDVVVITAEAVLGDTLPDFTNEVGADAFEIARAMAQERGVKIVELTPAQQLEQQLTQLTQQTVAMTADLDKASSYSTINPTSGGLDDGDDHE